MKIELTGWSSKGLRCPDVDIQLTLHGKVSPISLIQMPNGTGKTTTLDMLTATLNGAADKWTPEKVRSFQRPGEATTQGRFIVNLLVDEQPLTFELTLDYTEGNARYRTTLPSSGGVTAGHQPGPGLHRFLTPQFINLFVFDGEFADRMLDSTRAEAQKAIDALCQLYLLEDIGGFAEQEWQRATKKRTATTATGLTNWQRTRAQIQKRVTDLTNAQTTAKKQQAELETAITKLSELIAGHISNVKGVNERFQKAQADLALAETNVTRQSADLMQSVRLPYVLHPRIPGALVALKQNLDRLELPENTSAQFFEELVQESHCICGRELDDASREQIRTRAKQYLGTEEAGVINALKKDIDQYTAKTDDESGYDRMQGHVQALSTAVRERQQAEGIVRTLTQQLINDGDEQVRQWEDELQIKKQRLSDVQVLLRNLSAPGEDSEDSEKTFSISLLTKRLAEADQKISEITETVTLHEQTKLITRITAEARQQARDRIRPLVLAECNTTLRKVLSQDPIQLDRIDDSLHLAHQSGASVGQKLAVGYRFLMSVLSLRQNALPRFVAGPANPMDAGRRRQIGALVPRLCSQFVGFTISTERLGFVNALEATKTPIKYVTLFRKTKGTAGLVDKLPKKGVKQTGNAVIVEDRDYFHAFDLEE